MPRRVGSPRVWKVSSCDFMYIHYHAYAWRVKPFPMRFSDLSFCGHFTGHSPPEPGFPAVDAREKKLNSRSVAPTFKACRNNRLRQAFFIARATKNPSWAGVGQG